MSQKNSKEIARGRGGKPFIKSNPGVLAWRRAALPIIKTLWRKSGLTIPAGVDVECEVVAYQAKGQRIDIDNIPAAPLDALKEAGVISNDYWIQPLTIRRGRDVRDPRVVITLWWWL